MNIDPSHLDPDENSESKREDAEYRARMAALVDSSYDAIIGKDVTGAITSWNQGAERVYGYQEDEAVGQTIRLILPPDVQQEEPEILHAMQTGQRLEQFEAVRRRKDGSLIPVSLTVSPIANEQGIIIGSSTVERDITESQRHREELRRAKEEAEEANRVRAEFLANVSHELRTPMNAIIGMTQLALGEPLADEVRDYIQTANESAHSLLTLLNDILDFSKLESGKFSIEDQPYGLRETVEESVKSLAPRAFLKGLELACRISSDVPEFVSGDAVRIRQIITNLVSNAIKFTDRGEVVVHVELANQTSQPERLRFLVQDTGIGISVEDQRRILEPFTQVDASSTRRQGGTGLGLAICNELLQLMDSRLAVVSAPGEGSRFSFELDLHRVDASDTTRAAASRLVQLRQLPVLVVDDNQSNQAIISEILASWSMLPHAVSDGDEALRELDRADRAGCPYPVAIVDALMPGMDGYALSQHFAERTGEPPSVILMLSSSDRSEFKQREDEAAISEFVHKPVSQSDLLDALLKALHVQVVDSPRTRTPSHLDVQPRTALSVLLVEDTPANQRVVTSILKQRGHDVTVAQNGREAVEMFRQDSFDVVLMDVQMPIMDGFQATAAIREQQELDSDQTPIIAMTAHAMRGDREKCLEAGMDAYIAKPIDVRELVYLVECARRSDGSNAMAPESDAHSNADSSIIDYAGTMKRLAGDVELFREFITFFDEDSPKLLHSLHDAINRLDAAEVQRSAHALKGLAANFGAEPCVNIAHELEEAGRIGHLRGAGSLVAALEVEWMRLAEALEPYRGSRE